MHYLLTHTNTHTQTHTLSLTLAHTHSLSHTHSPKCPFHLSGLVKKCQCKQMSVPLSPFWYLFLTCRLTCHLILNVLSVRIYTEHQINFHSYYTALSPFLFLMLLSPALVVLLQSVTVYPPRCFIEVTRDAEMSKLFYYIVKNLIMVHS